MISPPNRMQESGPFADLIKQFNRLRDYAVSLRLGDGSTTATRRTSYGQILEKIGADSTTAQTADVNIAQFQVDSIAKETLSCYKIEEDGTRESSLTVVSKPHGIRVSSWDGRNIAGITYSNTDTTSGLYRSATKDYELGPRTIRGVVAEKLSAAYEQGEIIVAAKFDEGIGLYGAIDAAVAMVSDGVEWVDLNAGGKCWLAHYRIIEVCVDGQTRYMIVNGSDQFIA